MNFTSFMYRVRSIHKNIFYFKFFPLFRPPFIFSLKNEIYKRWLKTKRLCVTVTVKFYSLINIQALQRDSLTQSSRYSGALYKTPHIEGTSKGVALCVVYSNISSGRPSCSSFLRSPVFLFCLLFSSLTLRKHFQKTSTAS